MRTSPSLLSLALLALLTAGCSEGPAPAPTSGDGVRVAVAPLSLPSATSPGVANTLTGFDFGHPDNPDPFAPAPVANDTHEDLRRPRVAQAQLSRFFDTGELVHLCDGVCDPD